jgi:hypothetical protein
MSLLCLNMRLIVNFKLSSESGITQVSEVALVTLLLNTDYEHLKEHIHSSISISISFNIFTIEPFVVDVRSALNGDT